MLKFFTFTLFLLLTTNTFANQTASLAESQSAIQSPEGKAAFARIMDGESDPTLGEQLPNGITQDELSKLVFKIPFSKVQKESKCEFGSLAAYPWPGQPDFYIGVGSKINCDDVTNAPAKIYLTIFKIIKPHQFNVIAHAAHPFIFSSKDSDSNELNYNELVRIDHSKFQIAADQKAFGIRIATNQGYAGGFSHNQNIVLFIIKNNTLIPILNEPIYVLNNLAGEWNKDGTRKHDIQEQEWAVIIKATTHNGYYDLALKKIKGGHEIANFIWDGNNYKKINAPT